jgi:hypothetical protein
LGLLKRSEINYLSNLQICYTEYMLPLSAGSTLIEMTT